MCKSKMAVSASDPSSARTSRTRPSQSPRARATQAPRTPTTPTGLPTFTSASSSSSVPSTSNTTSAYDTTTSSSTLSSRTSLANLRESLSQNPHIYDISEIRAATNNFLARRYSSSSATPCWRCNLRNSEAIVFQRKFRRKIEMSQLKERLAVICRSHHMSVTKLLGASISGDHIYLVYEFINGANLAQCLRNSRNPDFTVLSTWMSRMQIATDLAHGLDYIHHKTGLNLTLVHNHIKSSSIVVTDASLEAKICHFGTAQLCGEVTENENRMSSISKEKSVLTEITEEEDSPKRSKELMRSDTRLMQFEGVRGYMSPEFRATGIASQKSDVYAFGVVILELLTGEEPFKYKYDKSTGDFTRTSVIETARTAIDGGDDGQSGGRGGVTLRKWVDRRLKDSFPVDVVDKLIRLALECVHVDPDKRPDMGRVAGKISKLYLNSKKWSDNVKMPEAISVSLAPR